MWQWLLGKKECTSCEEFKLEIKQLTIKLQNLETKNRDLEHQVKLLLEKLDASKTFNKPEEKILPKRKPVKDLFPGEDCFAIVKHFEKFYPKAYYCPGGVLTIGYGHTSAQGPPKVVNGMEITKEYAGEILINDLEDCAKSVKSHVNVPLFQYEFDALVSWTFNLGVGSLSSSTMLKRLNEKSYDQVSSEMKRWDKTGGKVLAGLTRRRRSEAFLFDTGGRDFFEDKA